MSGAWLKLYRRSIESQVFSDPHLWHLFCWCLMRANWKEGFFQGVKIPPGSFATGRDAAAESLGVSASALYRRLKKLEELKVIQLKANNRFTVISVVKWSFFQNSEQPENNQRTTGDTTSEQPADTIEEGNNSRREEGKKRVSVSADFDQWYASYPKKVGKDAAAKAYAKAIKSIEPAELLAASIPRLAELAKRDPQFVPHPATWLNSGGWQDDIAAIAPTLKSTFGPGQNYDPNHDYEKEVF
jgi:hypothetical protein